MSKKRGSPQVTVRIPSELLAVCKKAIKEGKARNMTSLIKKALVNYLELDPDYYLIPY